MTSFQVAWALGYRLVPLNEDRAFIADSLVRGAMALGNPNNAVRTVLFPLSPPHICLPQTDTLCALSLSHPFSHSKLRRCVRIPSLHPIVSFKTDVLSGRRC